MASSVCESSGDQREIDSAYLLSCGPTWNALQSCVETHGMSNLASIGATAGPVETHDTTKRPAWPLAGSIAALWIATAIELIVVLLRNRGHFVYGLDDVYIHMTIARNLALHGVWGLSPQHFSPASSGPLWTLLIAASYLLFGVNQYVPLILNLIVATAFVGCTYILLARANLTPVATFLTLLALVLVTPLPGLILTGEEHVLQAMLTVLFLDRAGDRLCQTDASRRSTILMFLLAALLGFVRYESLFLIGTAAALFVIAGEILLGFALAAAGSIPAIAMGLVSIAKGGFFLPSSVLIKSGSGNGLARFLTNWKLNIYAGPDVAVLAIVAAAALLIALKSLPREKWKNPTVAKTLLLLAMITAHLIFALVQFFRYDAYLVSASIYVLALNWAAPWSSRTESRFWRLSPLRLAGATFISLAAIVGVLRGIWIFVRTPTACHNIYSQQYQVAHFIKDCYQGQSIALNDIGAVSYFADIKLLDLGGLANVEIARAIIQHKLGPEEIERFAVSYRTKVAVLYPNWFDGSINGPLPAAWMPIAQWEVPNHWMLGGDAVVFYAVDPLEARRLDACLENYRSSLPSQVRVTKLWH